MPNPTLDQDRTAFLAAREKKGPVLLPAWPRQQKELPQVELEVGWVRFSTLNHRTRAEQLQRIHQTGRKDFFTSDPLGVEAQRAQYEILKSQESFNALKADLKDRGQQEPAIVTAEGVLINGNRRSAALRSLLQDDNFLKAGYVTCLLLPQDATADELFDLEAELQVAKDFKEDYSWINEALLIEELYNREQRRFDRVARRMRSNESAVEALYDKLQQVHQLVALSHGARLHLDFKDNESAFDELAKHIRNKQPAEANSVRDAYFLGTLANVRYRKLRHLRRADASALVRREIEADPALKPLLDSVIPASTTTMDDVIDDVLGSPSSETGIGGILGFLASKKLEETVDLVGGGRASVKELLESLQSAVTAAAEEAEEEVRDQAAAVAPIVRAEKAIVELERAIAALPRAKTFEDWDSNKLAAKVTILQELIDKLKDDE